MSLRSRWRRAAGTVRPLTVIGQGGRASAVGWTPEGEAPPEASGAPARVHVRPGAHHETRTIGPARASCQRSGKPALGTTHHVALTVWPPCRFRVPPLGRAALSLANLRDLALQLARVDEDPAQRAIRSRASLCEACFVLNGRRGL